MSSGDGSGVRQAEVVASLSLATDLALGQPMEHVLRLTRLAVGLSDAASATPEVQAEAFYVALLAWVGCVADAHELAALFVDDVQLRADASLVDRRRGPAMTRFIVRHAAAGRSPWGRVVAPLRVIVERKHLLSSTFGSHCDAITGFATQLGMTAGVVEALGETFERWDGKGYRGMAKEEIGLPIRLVQLATTAEIFHRVGGVDAALAEVRRRSGTQFDPRLVECLCDSSHELLDPIGDTTSWDEVIDLAPHLDRVLSDDDLDRGLEAFADFADIKSPFTLGHSRAVAELAGQAAELLELADPRSLHRAGLVHDLGAVGVSNAIWESDHRLSVSDQERVRSHPYLTERALARPEALGRIGALAGLHHERLDGSGYPHGLRADSLGVEARVLAAADVYQAMTEPRPHRPARTAEQAAAELRAEVTLGRLDGEATEAVLGAAGHQRRPPLRPGGLSPREVEVARLVSRGLKTKAIATGLGIAEKTVTAHIDHIYTKIDVSSRATLALWAVRQGLLPEEPSV